MGGHQASDDVVQLATQVGAAIAAAGHVLLTGGRDEGIMAAATRGARDAGGLTLAIHPGRRTDGEHADADIVVFTDMGWARNHVNILSSDAVIALPGAAGTMSEVAFADTHGVPTALLGFEDNGWFGDRVARPATLDEAMAWLARVFG